MCSDLSRNNVEKLGQANSGETNIVSCLNSVAFYIPSFGRGGVERTAVNLAAEFVKHGVRVDIVTFRADPEMLDEFPDSVNIVDLASGRTLTSLPKLISYLRRTKPKVLISAQAHANIIAVLAAKISRSKTKIVLTERLALKSTWELTGRFRDRVLPFLMRRFYRRADLLVANSIGTARQLSSVCGVPVDEINVVPNPAVPPEIFSRGTETVDHPWFAEPDKPIVLSVGRLTVQKDFPTLLNAFKLVRQKMSARLVVVGSGPLESDLKALSEELGVAEDVWMVGFDSNPYRYMTKSSVFVLTSRYEGLGNVLVEALALQLPVVASNCPEGPAEVLLNGEAGILTPMQSPEDTSDAIVSLLKDPDLGRAYVRAAEQSIKSYSVANCAKIYAELLL